jgi:two-component system sensor histidine kinase PilS (NtrC family)
MAAGADKNQSQRLMVAFSRISLYLLILLVSQISFLLQKSFINWSLVAPFYGALCLALFIHVLNVHFMDWLEQRRALHFATFIIDSLFLSILITYSGLNQSLFLFLHLVNILLAGLVFQSQGALATALFSSIFFTAASLFGPEMKAMNYVFLLALNNIAFFSVAGLAGYLSEQLQWMGRELTKTGLTLREIQELNKAIVSHMPSGLVTFDRNGRILQDNLSAKNIFSGRDLKAMNIFTLLPELQKKASESDQSLAEFKRDLQWAPSIDEKKLLHVSVTSVHSPVLAGDLYIAQIEDQTHVRKLEYSVRQNEKMAAVGGLAAGIAHEIRNPLASISGSVELLSQTTANEDDRKLMRIILREIDRLNGLITEFLDYSSPENPPTDPVDLVSLVKETLDGLKLNKQLREDIQLHCAFPAKAIILGRRDKLKQAFLNIILNAYQAMETVAKPSFSAEIQRENRQWKVILKDSGCGMSEVTLRRMFEPFHTTKSKGTGLGLAVTHKILEGHGAQVFVESVQGAGTTFTLTFPAVHG